MSLSLAVESLGRDSRDGDTSVADDVLVASSVDCAVDRVAESSGRVLTLPTAKFAGRRITNRCPSRRAIPCNCACGQYLVISSLWGIPMLRMATSPAHYIRTVFPVMVVILGGKPRAQNDTRE